MAKGNPNWGKLELVGTATVTEFEKKACQLNLQPDQYVKSQDLRDWAYHNSHSKYVPESLLRAWGIKVQVAV